MTLNDIIDLNLLNRFLTNLRSLFATKSEVAAKPTGKIYYGTCSTTANTYIKEATVETFPLDENDKPLVGTVVAIKYSVSNTYKTEGQTYALNVNNTGAYPMYYNNAAVATSTSANTLVAGYKNRHVFYVFNGTQWVWLSAGYDTNTTYSGMTQAEVDAGTGTTARLITPARLRDNFYTEGEVDTLLGSKANSNDLATVATSGSYNDLDDTPTIPTVPSASTDTPQMDGTGAAGSSSAYAKGDHVHPSDTSREARVTTVSHGTSDTTFALTPNVLHVWGTVNSLTLTLASGSSTYVDGYWFKFTAGSSFTALTMPSGVNWVTEPEIEAGKTYEVMIVDGLASYVTDGIGDSVKAKTRIVNHGTSDTTFTLTPNTFHIWGEVASLNLSLQTEASGFVSGYWFRFTCGSTPTTLTLPSSVEWYYDNVEFEANHTYEVTIVEGKACYTDYASTTHVATKQWVQNNTKTINGESIIGEGNIVIEGGESTSEIPVVNHGTSDTSISILPNVFHVWGEVSSLTLTLATGGSGVVNEYMFQFTSGSTPTSLSFSSSVSWITDSTIEANKTYQVSILNNLVVMGGV